MNTDRLIYGVLMVATVLTVICIIGLGFSVASLLQPKSEYVVDFAGSIHDPLPIVVVTTCSQQPQSDPDYRAYCDIPNRRAVVVTPDEWNAYSMGAPYHG